MQRLNALPVKNLDARARIKITKCTPWSIFGNGWFTRQRFHEWPSILIRTISRNFNLKILWKKSKINFLKKIGKKCPELTTSIDHKRNVIDSAKRAKKMAEDKFSPEMALTVRTAGELASARSLAFYGRLNHRPCDAQILSHFFFSSLALLDVWWCHPSRKLKFYRLIHSAV